MTNIEEIKNNLNIVDVLGTYIKLEKAGSNFKACCPFHNEKTPSFFVSPDRGTYKCFGCGEGGDIFSFVEKFEGIDFKSSLKILAEKAGVELKREDKKKVSEKNRIYDILEKTTTFFEKNLKEDPVAIKYLKDRGVNDSIIKQFRLGLTKKGWQNLYTFLKNNTYSDIEIEKAGLIKKREGKEGFYDRFRDRIIFPLFDNSEKVIAFSGRSFIRDNEEDNQNYVEQAKYLNSPETLLFNKSNILYAYNFAKRKIREIDFTILVEGQMDLLMCHQSGYNNTVASSGTSLTIGHIQLLKRLSDKLIIAFDGDEAGFNSACRVAKLALANGMEVKLMALSNGLDPADVLSKDKKEWQEAMKNAKHIIDYYLDKLINDIKDKRKLAKEIQEKVLPLILVIDSEIGKSVFVEDVANKLDVTKEAIWTELNKIKIDLPNNIKYHKNELIEEFFLNKQKHKKRNILRQLSGIYWWQKSLKTPIIDLLELEEKIKKIIGNDILNKIQKIPDKIKNEIIFEAEIFYEKLELSTNDHNPPAEQIDSVNGQKELKEKINELLISLEIELLNENMENIMSEQKEAQIQGNKKEAEEKFIIYNELSKKKEKLKN
ncbi:MAG: DNA primase [Candidatus Pacebacteria bacterium]|nr:DNA primase [Candidatus Paceibacterota bacterium]